VAGFWQKNTAQHSFDLAAFIKRDGYQTDFTAFIHFSINAAD
jgi:hypothetical protein